MKSARSVPESNNARNTTDIRAQPPAGINGAGDPHAFLNNYSELTAIALAQASIDRLTSSAAAEADAGEACDLAAALEILSHCGVEPPSSDHESADKPSFLGRFQVLEELGAGGFGIVFRAFDPVLKREVALKIPRPDRLVAGLSPDHFVREAQVAAGLEHSGIVRVYEARRIGPVWYIASAYCEGPTLADWIDSQVEPLRADVAAQIMAEIADALQFAHTRGVLHLDLKPQNVLLELPDALGRAPRPMVTDFGLAGKSDPQNGNVTAGLGGTPAYMAPEQSRGDARHIGTTTDVYALGAILYELLKCVGNSPADTEDDAASPALPGLTSRMALPDVSPDLNAICQKCLRPQPSERYESARELASDLRRFLNGEMVTARQALWYETAWRKVRRRPVTAALGTLLAMTVTVGIMIIAYLWRQAESNLADFRAERDLHAQTADRMQRSLLNLTWLTQEIRLEPRVQESNDDTVLQLLRDIHNDVEIWASGTKVNVLQATALRAAAHSLALTDGVLPIDRARRNQEFVTGMHAWRDVIAREPAEPQWRRALALHMLTYAAGLDPQRWRWWHEPQPIDPPVDEAVAELAAEEYACLLLELAHKSTRLGKYTDAYLMLDSAVTTLHERESLPDETDAHSRTLLTAYILSADVAWRLSKPAESAKAVKLLESLAASLPPAGECSPLLAMAIGDAHGAVAKAKSRQQDHPAALAAFERAHPYLLHATVSDPDRAFIRIVLARNRQRAGAIHARLFKHDEAISKYRDAMGYLDHGIARAPGHRELIQCRARLAAVLAKQYAAVGDKAAELACSESAVRDFDVFGLTKHDTAACWLQVIECWQSIGRIHGESGRNAESIAAFHKSHALLAELEPRRSLNPKFKKLKAQARDALAITDGATEQ